MLSILYKIKNKLFSKKVPDKKSRQHKYNIVFGDHIMTVDLTNDDNDDVGTTASAPPPTPTITQRLFNTEIEESIINKDYELQSLLHIMNIRQFSLENVTLERKIEEAINSIPAASDIMKIKLKILYIIIANDMYQNIFEEKKLYHSTKIKQLIGVFRYNDYIIRIDDSPYSFIN